MLLLATNGANKEKRAVELGKHMTETGDTVRCTAAIFGISKSTVHKYVTIILPKVNIKLAKQVRTVLDKNKSERHLRGGMATKARYALKKKK